MRLPAAVTERSGWPVSMGAGVKRRLGAEEARFQFLLIVEERPGAGEVEYFPRSVVVKRAGAASACRVDVRVVRAGWPLHAVGHERWHETGEPLGTGVRTRVRRTEGHPTSAWRLGLSIGGGERRLGIRPLWPGFAVDTAVYGVLAFVLWSGPRVVRRVGRRWRGVCVACGYEAGAGVCPECGGGRA